MGWKTYEEMNLNDCIAGSDLLLYQCVETEHSTRILAKSRQHTCSCPKCGQISSMFHSTYGRSIQIFPINMKPTYVQPILYEFVCENPDCSVKTFTEKISCAEKWARRSDLLNQIIFAVSVFLSDEGASRVLRLMGIEVSGDTINRIYEKMEIQDDPDITSVGIDDVAIRKGQTYATAIYDMKDHHLVALLDGRSYSSVSGWLKAHPKVKVVARDRACAYASAISEIIPECMQVADRFHLLQNLLDRFKNIFGEVLPENFYVQNGCLLDKIPDKIPEIEIPLTEKEAEPLKKYDNSPPLDQNGNIISIDDVFINPHDKRPQQREANRLKKQNLIKDLRKTASEVPHQTQKELAEKYKISVVSVAKYLKMSDAEVESVAERTHRKRTVGISKLRNWANVIYKMHADNISPPLIVRYVKYLGYEGRPSSLDHRRFPPTVIIISRMSLLKYMTSSKKPSEDESSVAKYYSLIEARYPKVKRLMEIWETFHSAVMGTDPSEIDGFIEKNSSSEFSEIQSFVNGLTKDKEAVKNAVKYDTNSGFVEGNNCKFKLIKRVLYGRSSLQHLFRKCYAAFRFA